MEIQVATLCDSAADYNGKLSLLGTFNTICSNSLPIIHPQCSLALRICFKPGDEGDHQFTIRFINADGKEVMPPFTPIIHVEFPDDGYFITRNLILNLQRLQFEKPGQFSIDISVDNKILTQIPLRLMLLE